MTAHRAPQQDLDTGLTRFWEEFLAWFQADDEQWPERDWDVVVTMPETVDWILDLAAEPAPAAWKEQFLLRCLYLHAGEAVGSDYRFSNRERLLVLCERAKTLTANTARWAHETEQLIDDPSRFEYGEWCLGGIARRLVPSE